MGLALRSTLQGKTHITITMRSDVEDPVARVVHEQGVDGQQHARAEAGHSHSVIATSYSFCLTQIRWFRCPCHIMDLL